MQQSNMQDYKVTHCILQSVPKGFADGCSMCDPSLLMVRVGDRAELQPRDSREVGWIACIERQRMCDRAGRDECVVRAGRGLAPRCAQCRRDGAKCPRTSTIERQNIKVRLGLANAPDGHCAR